MKAEKIIAGTIKFGNKIDLTDPCYDKRVWCRINDVEIEPGEYTCIAYVKDCGAWGNRVSKAGIYLNGKIRRGFFPLDGEVGVDSGLAGFFTDKNSLSDDEWREFCNLCSTKYPTILVNEGSPIHGFCVSSGYGDGGYQAFAHKNPKTGKIDALEIKFITQFT